MASKTISNLKDSISGQLQGLSMNTVKNLYTALERVARQTCSVLDIPEARLQQNISLYDGVTDYTFPTNILASSIIDVRPQGVTRWLGNTVQKHPTEEFDREKEYIADLGTHITADYDAGTGVLRIVSPYPLPRIELDAMTDDSGWTADGTYATGLTTDSSIFYQAPSSLVFQLATGTGTISKTITSADLTDYKTSGVIFIPFYASDVSKLTSLAVRIGSDSANYYEITVTTGFIKAFTSGEWNMASFDMSGATVTGSPDITKIAYLEILATVSGALANFHVGDCWIALPSPTTVVYSTPAIFQATGATTPSTTITMDTDTINLNDAAYAIYEVMCAIDIANQQGGTVASEVIASLQQKVNGIKSMVRGHLIVIQEGMIDLYTANNPSERLRQTGSYYEGFGTNGY